MSQSIKTGPAVPRMTLTDKIFVWFFVILITGAAVLSVLTVIDFVCAPGTDRWEEIQRCWFNFKWGVR